jgi:hypothetical protein
MRITLLADQNGFKSYQVEDMPIHWPALLKRIQRRPGTKLSGLVRQELIEANLVQVHTSNSSLYLTELARAIIAANPKSNGFTVALNNHGLVKQDGPRTRCGAFDI